MRSASAFKSRFLEVCCSDALLLFQMYCCSILAGKPPTIPFLINNMLTEYFMSVEKAVAENDLSEAESNSILEVYSRDFTNLATRKQMMEDLVEFGDNILRIRKKDESSSSGYDSETSSDESSPSRQ